MGRGLQAAPGLVCFDLDGTLYHDDRIYLRMIDYYFAGTPWEKEIGSVKAEMSRVLAGGNPAFRCGRFAPKEWGVCPGPAAALLAVPTEAALLRPDPSPWLDRRCWSYISDGWSLAMYLARRIGWDGEAFWERFQLARRDLLTDGVGPNRIRCWPGGFSACGTAASGLCCAQIPGGREERRFWPGWGCWGALTSRFLTRRSPTPLRNVWKGGAPAGGYHLTRCCLWGTRDTATCTPACGPERAPCGFLHTQRMMRAFGMPVSARRRS